MRATPSEASAAADLRPLAAIKTQPEDWRVHEHLGWPFAGYGEHLYLYIEKRNLNTAAVAGELIKRYGVRPQDIGFAGLKDKHGITRQWFSITTPSDSIDEDLRSTTCRVSDEYIVCLQAARHTHKLRRGSHSHNDFVITLRGDTPAYCKQSINWQSRLQITSGRNVLVVITWLLRDVGWWNVNPEG